MADPFRFKKLLVLSITLGIALVIPSPDVYADPTTSNAAPSNTTPAHTVTAPFGASSQPAGQPGGYSSGSNPGTSAPAPVSAGVSPMQKGTAEHLGASLLDPNYQKCGQDCIYQRANETLSLQVDYVLAKRTYLLDKDHDDADKRKLLGGFCSRTPSAKDLQEDDYDASEGESIKECTKRYLRVTGFWLLKARSALGKNERSIANLSCGKWDSTGKCIEKSHGTAVGYEAELQKQELQKKANVTYLAKPAELAAIAAEREKLKYAQIDNKQWDAGALFKEYKPSPDDFVKFRKTLRDPSNPASGYLEVPATKGNGQLDYDEAAYKRALAAWKYFNNYIKPTAEGVQLKEVVKQNQQQFIQNFKAAPNATSDVSRRLYNEERDDKIQFVTEHVDPRNGWGKKELNYPGKSTANTTNTGTTPTVQWTPKPPPGGYTGNLDVKMPSTPNTQQDFYFRTTGSQIGVQSREADHAPKIKVDRPTGVRTPTSNKDNSYSNTPSAIDLYF